MLNIVPKIEPQIQESDLSALSSFSTDHSKKVPLLQFFVVCETAVSILGLFCYCLFLTSLLLLPLLHREDCAS